LYGTLPMSKQVKGFLAPDGTFFDHEPECRRYESMKNLERVCDSHGTNFENFMICLNAWHKTIKEYYNADSKCKAPEVGKKDTVEFQREVIEPDGDEYDYTLPRTEGDTPDPTGGDKDAPGFLEQQIRKRI